MTRTTSHQIKDTLMNISAYQMQGRRSHMEDYFDIAYRLKPVEQRNENGWPYEFFYFGIFDGHGGHEAAQFAKSNLVKFISKQSDFWSNNDQDVLRAIQKGFADTHSAMKRLMPTWARAGKVLPSTAGTTASVLFIRNGKFYTGHVGDSRIVIAKENPETKYWIADELTEDHKPDSLSEMLRIERAGGDVKRKIGVARVVWRRPVLNKNTDDELSCLQRLTTCHDPKYEECLKKFDTYPLAETIVDSYQAIPFLAIARSLGDFWSINPYSGQYVVSPEPDVACRPITSEDKCILLATDGLWNVMTSPLAVRILQELKIVNDGERNSEPYCNRYFNLDNYYDVSSPGRKNHALSLVYTAYQTWERRRLRADNITAIVAMIDDILSPLSISQQASPCKTYSTRASNKSHRIEVQNNTIEPILSNQPNQIQQTSIYCENICLSKIPDLCPYPPDIEHLVFLRQLENFIIFPPTVLRQELVFQNGLVEPPKNYLRLSHARLKKLKRYDSPIDSYIYIKRVSDDPDDRKHTEARTNKIGKRVRDSSAQATQTIHDFGQPWDQLTSEEECAEFDEDGELVYNWSLGKACAVDDSWDWVFRDYDAEESLIDDFKDDEDDEDDDDNVSDFADDKDRDQEVDGPELVEEENNDDIIEQNECNIESSTEDNSIENNVIKCPVNELEYIESPTIPQLRCLMNCNGGDTPNLRRSTRSGTYLSATDNSKRKSQQSAITPKSKRRKSHPIPCAVAQA